MRLASPWALFLLVLLPALLLHWRRQTARPALVFSHLDLLPAPGTLPSWRLRLRHLPAGLRLLGLALLILALARPQAGQEKVREVRQGVAIEMVVDRSGSMGSEMHFDGRSQTRLEVVKKVFAEFVAGNGQDGLAGRPSDLIGMVSFAGYADTVCPLTLSHDTLLGFLDTIHLVERQSPENRTALGDAIALAAARLRTAEESLARQAEAGDRARDYSIQSKLIILLTDGRNNAGQHSPEEAAALARDWGIKVYTIGVGGDETQPVETLFGTRLVRTGEGVDRQTLRRIAETTGGLFRLADDGQALRAVYQEIDQLEKSQLETMRHIEYKEYFGPLALLALALFCLEIPLSATLLRRLP